MNIQIKLLIPVLVAHLSSPALADEEGKSAVAAKAATASTAELVSSFSTASFFNPVGLFRIQLGEWERPRGAAASDDSEFETTSFSATPTMATIDNNIEPILVDGRVSLLILGIESFNELDLIAKGITLTLDQTSVTSTEVASGASRSSSKVTGQGWTIAPYYVTQLENGDLLDLNAGVGQNSLATSSSGVTADPSSTRAFWSIGLTRTRPVTESMYVQYKGAMSYTYDKIGGYSQSSGTAVATSTTKLAQARIGATLSRQMGAITPFVAGSIIGNSFRSEGGSGSDPKEYSATALVKTGFNFSTDLFYGSLAYQAERDKSSAQFYIGYRF